MRIILILAMLGLAACSATEFKAANKDAVLKSQSVLSNPNDAEGQIRQPGSGGDAGGQIPQPGANTGYPRNAEDALNGIVTIGSNAEQVVLMCSDGRTSAVGTNLKGAIARNEALELKVSGTLCTTNATTIKNLFLRDTVSINDLKAICSAAVGTKTSVDLTLTANGKSLLLSYSGLTILYANNGETSDPATVADSNCDQRSSPLVIHRASDPSKPQPVALSSRADGVDFDLLGDRNDHRKVRISWFTNSDYYLLALPDRHGEVKGIDQLFGDNTKGPDGAFADNGYAALAKYDDNGDNVIDAQDRVFRSLKLWLDKNRDGVGQRRELVSVADAGLKEIDLEYSTDYAERDQYGNETKMKSVVTYLDGTMDLIFDLWFSFRLQ